MAAQTVEKLMDLFASAKADAGRAQRASGRDFSPDLATATSITRLKT
jgi:hypothetical protein